jgi:hypothetical protein
MWPLPTRRCLLRSKKTLNFAESVLQHDTTKACPDQNRVFQKKLVVIDRARGQLMRRRLRKSIPFLLAIMMGSMAGAVIAGVAILVSHS